MRGGTAARPGGLARRCASAWTTLASLLLRCTVTEIVGRGRLEGVVLCQVDEAGPPCARAQENGEVDCDTLLLSVGLIQKTRWGPRRALPMDPVTNGAGTDVPFSRPVCRASLPAATAGG